MVEVAVSYLMLAVVFAINCKSKHRQHLLKCYDHRSCGPVPITYFSRLLWNGSHLFVLGFESSNGCPLCEKLPFDFLELADGSAHGMRARGRHGRDRELGSLEPALSLLLGSIDHDSS